MDSKRSINARKKPSQQRSKEMVVRIFSATEALLKNHSDVGAPKLSTSLISKQAGISVGSLYQYFPNVESILYALYQEIMDKVLEALDEFDSASKLSLPRKAFFSELTSTSLQAEADPEVTYAMHQAMKTYPVLQEMDKQHAEKVAKKIAGFLKYYGSQWDLEELERLALYTYYINYGTWVYREHIRPPNDEATQWELGVMDQLLDRCFD